MTITCRRCKQNKSHKDYYVSKRTKTGFEYICKQCKKIECAAQKYHSTCSFIEYLYSHKTCMCCRVSLDHKRQTHIHHTDDGIQGLVCFSCNYILGQETQADLDRILCCLDFMKQDRENLFDRVNQQERPNNIKTRRFNIVGNPQRLARHNPLNSKVCIHCGDTYTKSCLNCARIYQRAKTHGITKEQAHFLYNVPICDCCGTAFTKKNKRCIHHVKDRVLGVICNRCNTHLGSESEECMMRLLACKLWIEENMIQSDLYGNIKKLAEMTSSAA